MEIGLNSTATNTGSLDGVLDDARLVSDTGLSSLWVPNYFGLDALTCLAVVGREVSRIRLGTAVVPIQTRHPFAMAQQALTLQAAVGGRLTLGLGLSHRRIVEGAWGLDFVRPAATMRDYLLALAALSSEATDGAAVLAVPDRPSAPTVHGAAGLPVLVAALGPRMADVAGTLADGVVLWCAGPRTIARIARRLRRAADAVGRPAPRVVASLPVCVSSDAGETRNRIGRRFRTVDQLPSYRAALDEEGVDGIADLALVGDRGALVEELARLAEAGVTEFAAMVTAADGTERAETLDALVTAAAVLR